MKRASIWALKKQWSQKIETKKEMKKANEATELNGRSDEWASEKEHQLNWREGEQEEL